MTTEGPQTAPLHPLLRILQRKSVLSGLMFIGIAALGLWLSRNYPVGTALRMSTGYMPRLLCWLLMGLGLIVLVQGLLDRDASTWTTPQPKTPRDAEAITPLRVIVMVTLSLVAFGLALEPLGLVVAIVLLVVTASFATHELKPWETLAAAAGLSVLSWAIFVRGLGLTISVWPQW